MAAIAGAGAGAGALSGTFSSFGGAAAAGGGGASMGSMLGGLGNLMGGAGGLMGGISNLFGGGDDDDEKDALKIMDKQFDYQQAILQNQIQWRAEDARKAGLHPLAALGAASMSFNPSMVGGYGNKQSSLLERMGRAGQDIGAALNKLGGVTQRQFDVLRLAQEREKLDNMKLQNVGLRNQIYQNSRQTVGSTPLERHLGITGQDSPPAVSAAQAAAIYEPPTISTSKRPGVQSGTQPLERDVINVNGNLERFPTQNMSDTMESSPYHGMKYFLRKVKDHALGVAANVFPGGVNSPAFRRQLRFRRPAAPDGYAYVYEPGGASWELIRWKSKSEPPLFSHSKWWHNKKHFFTMPQRSKEGR